MKKENLKFRISSGLKSIIGKELITNEIVAIFELVKNSYDAGATKVEILINENESEITIADNGCGMSYRDLKNKWLFVAYSEKSNSKEKSFAGSKGIGRFSCDRLGERLNLYSKTEEESVENSLEVNWNQFEKDPLKEFSELDAFYSKKNLENKVIYKNGTTLIISNLRDMWDEKRVKKVFESLQKLINPFEEKTIDIKLTYIEKNALYPTFTRNIENNILEILESKTVSIECSIEENTIDILLVDNKKEIYKVRMKNTTVLNKINFKVYFLNQTAKNNFKRKMGVTTKDYGSLFLYKNGFRIYPYGEIDFDGFGLNIRKTQGYNRYLGNREILGWINVKDNENHFKEVSSRDGGFIENIYTKELEEVYLKYVHRSLEDYVTLTKYGILEIDGILNYENKSVEKLVKRFKKDEIIFKEAYELPSNNLNIIEKIGILSDEKLKLQSKEEIQKEIVSTIKFQQKEIKLAQETNRNLSEKNVVLQKEIKNKNDLIFSERPDRQDFLAHELNITADSIESQLIKIKSKLLPSELEKIEDEISKIERYIQKLKSIQRIVLNVDVNTKVKNDLDILSFITEYLRKYPVDKVKVETLFDRKSLVASVKNLFDFGVLLDNLIKNVLDLNGKRIIFDADEYSFSFISDTGPIKQEDIDKIFSLGYSTTDGTGLGMYFVKQICDEFKWDIKVSNINNNVKFDFYTKGRIKNEENN